MDAFYAAVEQRDKPELIGKPVVVGGSPGHRGVVSTCSYEARQYGIHSAMSSTRAQALCPHAVFIRPDFARYRQASQQIFSLLRECTDRVETLSLDEAYMDVTELASGQSSATELVVELKRRIRTSTGLSASAGVSYNKFLAKIASDVNKPDGLFVIKPSAGERYVAQLPIRKFYGIGAATEKRMRELGVRTGADLRRYSLQQLIKVFGKTGLYYYNAARGIDHRPVQADLPRKSFGAESTFEHDLRDQQIMLERLNKIALKVARMLVEHKLSGRTLSIKIKYADFTQITRSHTLPQALTGFRQLRSLLPDLLSKTEAARKPVRLLGVSVSNLRSSAGGQKSCGNFRQPGFLDN